MVEDPVGKYPEGVKYGILPKPGILPGSFGNSVEAASEGRLNSPLLFRALRPARCCEAHSGFYFPAAYFPITSTRNVSGSTSKWVEP